MALEMGSERVPKWAQPEDGCLMRLSQAHAPELAAPALLPASLELLLQTAPSLTWYPPLKSPFPALTLSTCSALNDLAPLGRSSHLTRSSLPFPVSYLIPPRVIYVTWEMGKCPSRRPHPLWSSAYAWEAG